MPKNLVNPLSFIQATSLPGRILPNLQSLAAFQADNAEIFPSIDSLRWALRKYREVLAAGGAIAIIAGRTYIDRERFAPLILKVGNEQAQKR